MSARMAVGRRRLGGGVAALVVALALLAPLGGGSRATPAALAATPGMTLQLTPTGNPLPPVLTLEAVTAATPESIAQISFEYAPADTGRWTTIGMNPSARGSLPPYSVDLDTTGLDDGLYDFRAVLTDTAGGPQVVAKVRDQLVANAAPVVALTEPGANLATGSPLRQSVPLRAVVSSLGPATDVATISFEISRGDQEQWRPIGTVAAPTTQGTQAGSVVFETTRVPDGTYDIRAVPNGPTGRPASTIPVRGVVVDNTPPSVSLADPGSPLTGSVTLSTQTSDAGSGPASVEFERAVTGTGAWKRIGMSAQAPFAHAFDTTSWDDGTYDLRAIATDRAGNLSTSNVVRAGVTNPPRAAPAPASIAGVAIPARNVTMLGSVAGSPTHETWAYGFTSAPPASVAGRRLPYTAPGDQFVLLRYTDGGGWQIADVLRQPDGSAFRLLPADAVGTDPVEAAGRMTPSGEAWLWILERSRSVTAGADVVGLFHRAPGGAFELDPAASAAVGTRLLASGPGSGALRLGQGADGHAYGILTAPSQPDRSAAVPRAGGTSVTVAEKLDYALLRDGAWSVRTAPLPDSYQPRAGDLVRLRAGDVDGPGSGWGALGVERPVGTPAPLGLVLGHFQGDQWSYVDTGLDALDLTGSVANASGSVSPSGLKADGSGVWVGANVRLPTADSPSAGGPVVARYDAATRRVTNSWCSLPVANSCDEPLDHDHPAAVPDAIFSAADGAYAVSLQRNSLDVFTRGDWTGVPAPGYAPIHGDAFSGPGEGWLGGQSALGQVSAPARATPLAGWPISVRSPLTSVALPPGGSAGLGESGALAVGLSGTTVRYDANAGWVVEPAPPRTHHINLTAVAFAAPSSAFAVGQFGVILHWDGSAWSEDRQSISLTQSPLNAVAFAPSGEGWAVGGDGTILHYAGGHWSTEPPPPNFAATNISSVAVAGPDVFAIADGSLIERGPSGTWTDADPALLPADPAPVPGSLRLVSGLPDGGAVISGLSVVLVRQHAGEPFAYSEQPLEGIAVGAAVFREAGTVRAAVSVAAPAADTQTPYLPTRDIGGFPAGDGELVIETADGWRDLSRAQYAGVAADLPPDGGVKPDPVLAVATSPDGRHAWAVGGYAGTVSASGQGAAAVLPARPAAWQTASLWRYDAGASAPAPALSASTPNLPANPGTVSFAFFSSPACRIQCADTLAAQPDTNLGGALAQISTYAAQPGGPVFAMLGGNARGPLDTTAWGDGNGAADFSRLPDLLAPLSVPLFAAYGPLDAVPTRQDPAQPWSDTFAGAPAPFGNGGRAAAIAPASSPSTAGAVSRHYAFDATRDGATVRVIVLDNSKGSLEASSIGQSAWLDRQLAGAVAGATPIVAVAALPLHGNATTDGARVATRLAAAGVLAVFTGAGTSQLNERHDVPDDAAATIPEYEGATLGYQQAQNNGVVWYDVSVDTQSRKVAVNAVPVIQSLSLEPLTGLSVARSLTLQFQGIGRRPQGSLATAVQYDDTFPGLDSYVEIPAPGCGTRPCVTPTYTFASSDPSIGTFVTPSGPGSPIPKLDGKGRPVPNSGSGLFCAFNAGTTDVSVTAGLLTYSLTVTVQPGGFGAPCGTAPLAAVAGAVKHATPVASAAAAAAPPPPPAAASAAPAPLVGVAPVPVPQPAPHPLPQPAPHPVAAAPPAPTLPGAAPVLPPLPALVPPITPAQPIPPGGATAPGVSQSPAAAQRREKARKHASQSAFTTRMPGGGDLAWYYGGVGLTTLLALVLAGQGLRARRDPAELRARARDRM